MDGISIVQPCALCSRCDPAAESLGSFRSIRKNDRVSVYLGGLKNPSSFQVFGCSVFSFQSPLANGPRNGADSLPHSDQCWTRV